MYLLSLILPSAVAAFEAATDNTNLFVTAAIVGAITIGGLSLRTCRTNSSGKQTAEPEKVKKGSTQEDNDLPTPVTDKAYTLEEVKKHNSEGSCWIIVEDKVYDATPYLCNHPGGAYAILQFAGDDATEDYKEIHSAEADKLLARHQIGYIAKA
mmetsp:Transcript_6053/g.8396  ORF Transcript_6053/g.8396 Transcript_6053/m.8396 type:complete len:154 (-) Transcript_6053:339-800(-)|eukprot:CAMPEP_0184480520 /NCGR_PEP_ID=MMETSP0113_2-20130426/2028_1 /TAXON_ID=91329 /ORGANISM="Norrisiella sphaerica, Strain BC52" /LENGTH=153 /DNA_ID=CAMNT_0026859059 /DNA_START=169 /DNA_END=630 /DNA_ORIENTATION=-